MQVYLPDNLYRAVKRLGLPASELLQKAVSTELHRRKLLAAGDRHLKELVTEVGEPSVEEQAEANALVAAMVRRARSRTRAAG
jgi:hypothetical protein